MNNNLDLIKVCFLIPSLGPGGMERVMSELIWNFSKRKNVELHVILFGKEREIFYDIPNNIIIHKPNFEFCNKHRKWHTIKTMLFIRSEVNNIKPSTILSFGELWNNLVLLSLLHTKYPIYVSDRCQPNKSFGKKQDLLRKWLYTRATGVIAQTQKAKEIYQTQFKHNNIVVIGNPIRDIKIKSREKENIVLSIGRLIDSKNYNQLIDIFSRIDNKNWKLIIVGGDALRQNNSTTLHKQIDELKQTDRIKLVGTQKDVESFLSISRIFAFTSSSEGFPNAIGEAMSSGLPVIAYDCVAGPSDMINNGINGFLIPLFDQKMFEEKLKFLMNNPEVACKLGEQAKSDIFHKFSSENIGESYYKTITRL